QFFGISPLELVGQLQHASFKSQAIQFAREFVLHHRNSGSFHDFVQLLSNISEPGFITTTSTMDTDLADLHAEVARIKAQDSPALTLREAARFLTYFFYSTDYSSELYDAARDLATASNTGMEQLLHISNGKKNASEETLLDAIRSAPGE